MPQRKVTNFTRYNTEDLIRLVEYMETFLKVSPVDLARYWGAGRGFEFVPYANTKGVMKYAATGSDGRRYVSELNWGLLDISVGLIDPRAANNSPIAELLGPQELGEAPRAMVEQILQRIMNSYPGRKNWQDLGRHFGEREGQGLRLRFRPGLSHNKSNDEKRLERILKARKNLQSILAKYQGIVSAAETTSKNIDSVVKHLKGEEVGMVDVVPSLLKETHHALHVLRYETLSLAHGELSARAEKLAKEM